MRIISLACKSCSAPLQIKEGMEQLACAHCGAQMYVEREGGTISLQLMEALGSIRTGAVQTAAELALVRLKEERINCLSGIGNMRSLQSVESLCNETEKDLLSESELASAQVQETELKAKAEGLESLMLWTLGVEGVATVIAAIRLWLVTDGFLNVLGAFISKGILWLGAAFVVNLVLFGVSTLLASNPDGALRELKEKLGRHQVYLQYQAEFSRLTEAHARLAHIDEEIARNDKVVRQK